MKPACFLLAVWLLPLPLAPPEERIVQGAEEEMSQRPRDAFLIARQAAGKLAQRPDLVQRLFQEAARRQEAQLALLDETQVADLADYYRQQNDREAANRVQQRWLSIRRKALGPGKGTERLQLARLAWKWLKDRTLAADLCREALQEDPNLAAATHMLQEDLSYRRTGQGWIPQEQAAGPKADSPGALIRVGMTAEEVRKLRGPPARIAREHWSRHYLEQWTYEQPTPLRIEFSRAKGQEPQVVRILPAPEEKSEKMLQPK